MKFFTYGIFLDERTRASVGIMDRAVYDTVKGYSTKGGHIVQAFPCEGHTLTGMLVEVPDRVWPKLDAIEGGYDRITVTTTSGRRAQMYVQKRRNSGF